MRTLVRKFARLNHLHEFLMLEIAQKFANQISFAVPQVWPKMNSRASHGCLDLRNRFVSNKRTIQHLIKGISYHHHQPLSLLFASIGIVTIVFKLLTVL